MTMKKIRQFAIYLIVVVFFLVGISLFATPPLPSPTSSKYVNDYVGILDRETSSRIVSIGKELEDTTSAQSIVVIIPTTQGIPIADYALQLFRTWGLGQKNKDNGLLLLVSLEDRSWRVEVGRGLEGAIPDALSSRIMEALAKPEFANGNYSTGILNAYSSFADSIATEYGVTLTKSLNIALPPPESSSQGGTLTVSIIAVLLLLDILLNRGRVTSSFLQIFFWSNVGRRGGYGGGRGGNNGGFGGFGGGSSNGGGSSGQW